MTRLDRSTRVFLCVAATWLAAVPAGAQVVIARQGDVAPGTGGGTFNIFSPQPALNDLGHVAFWSTISGGTTSQGVFLERGNGLIAVAVDGDVAPGSGGGTFILVGEPALGGAGDLAFATGVLNGTFGSALYLYSNGQLTTIATSLDPAPGTIGGTYSAFGPRLSMNASGEIAFNGDVTGAGNTSSGIFVEGGPSSRAVFLRGGSTPAALPGTYNSFGDASINTHGDVVAVAGISPTVGAFRNGIVLETGGVDEIVALVGDPAPGTGAGTFSSLNAAATPAIDASRKVFFHANVTGGTASSGLFVDDGMTQSAFALPGQLAPGTGGANYFAFTITRFIANDAGELGFQAMLNTGAQTHFLGTSGASAQRIAGFPDPIPGTGGGSIFILQANPAINASGRAAFVAQLSGGTTASAVIAVPEPGSVESSLVVFALLAYAAGPMKRRLMRHPDRQMLGATDR